MQVNTWLTIDTPPPQQVVFSHFTRGLLYVPREAPP